MRLAIVALALVASCAAPRRSGVGRECELNSECAAPLVCRIGYCRNECATSGDCPAPLACVQDQYGLGACQTPFERTCTLATDCVAPLICRLRQCVNECAADRDCPGGARCMVEDGVGACIDPSTQACAGDGECRAAMPGTFCLAGRCREQCHTDRDCRRGLRCDPAGACLPADAIPDGGAPHDAAADAGGPDAGEVDGGDVDGGASPCTGGPLTGVVQLAVGRDHACALADDAGGTRRVYCWGGPGPQIGTLGPAECATEVEALAGRPIAEIAAGAAFTCVRETSGVVSCFGHDFGGQLGRGGTGADPMPVAIAGLVATSIVLGGHACARTSPTALSCWGTNTSMQLGDGTTINRTTPVSSTFAPSATALALGRLHSCGLDATLAPICWGDDALGQLGNGPGGATITGARMVTSGGEHTCALAGTTAYCWGHNVWGALGDGTTTSRDVRQPVTIIGPATAIEAGNYHTCAIVAGDGVCWGMSDAIEPGATHAVLAPVTMFPGPTSLHAGDDFTCALTGGSVSCVGANTFGVLGDGTTTARYTPQPVRIR